MKTETGEVYEEARSGAFGRFRGVLGPDPDLLRGGWTERNAASIRGKSEGLIVIPPGDSNPGPRPDAAPLEKFEQPPVALIDSAHNEVFSRFGLCQQHQPATPPAGGAFHFTEVAVRASALAAEFGQQLSFEVK